MNKQSDDAARSVWQSQAIDAPRISVEYVRLQAEKWNAAVGRERSVGYWTAVACAVAAGVYWLLPETTLPGGLERINALAAAVFFVGIAYGVACARLRYRSMLLASDDSLPRFLDAYRQALQSRLDLHRASSRWMVWPLIAGIMILFGGRMIYDPGPQPILTAIGMILGMLCAREYFRYSARRRIAELQQELDALKTLG